MFKVDFSVVRMKVGKLKRPQQTKRGGSYSDRRCRSGDGHNVRMTTVFWVNNLRVYRWDNRALTREAHALSHLSPEKLTTPTEKLLIREPSLIIARSCFYNEASLLVLCLYAFHKLLLQGQCLCIGHSLIFTSHALFQFLSLQSPSPRFSNYILVSYKESFCPGQRH